jgi:hypothetical protein
MEFRVSVPDFATWQQDVTGFAKDSVTEALSRTVRRLEKDMEAATVAAGLSRRLARTWASKVYPANGRTSLTPGGFLWSKAPGPMRAFTEGATIRGKAGGYLAIPSEEVLKVRGRGVQGQTGQRITPGGFERATGIKLRLVKGVGRIGFLIGDRAIGRRTGRNKRRAPGFRPLTPGRAKRGAKAETFLAFTLVPSVTLRKRLSVEAVLRSFGPYFASALSTQLKRDLVRVRQRERLRAQVAAAVTAPANDGFPGLTRIT